MNALARCAAKWHSLRVPVDRTRVADSTDLSIVGSGWVGVGRRVPGVVAVKWHSLWMPVGRTRVADSSDFSIVGSGWVGVGRRVPGVVAVKWHSLWMPIGTPGARAAGGAA
ncbi:MAG: hypothetical protein QOE87_870, partial [Gaiellales bacterium]|nr:hypothetical protein [Gaiellales bacterium]